MPLCAALDAVWTLQTFMPDGKMPRPEQMVRVREALYHKMKGLSAFTKGNIVKDNFKGYSLDPFSRYKSWSQA